MATTPLQRELRQARPFESPAQEAALGLVRTADRLRRHFSSFVEPHGITVQQFNVLRILRGAGPEALPTLEIAERMVEQTPGVTRLLDRLEAKQLIARARCPNDRRQVLCRITPVGLALLAGLDEPIRRAHQQALGVLPVAAQRQLIGLLDRVRAGGIGGLERCRADQDGK
ncbi:MAG: MarR family transcriptional regulator [Vicinamibacteria bacterium]|nr:MarR family transcriptional regulator [Vicinamibacteria bacterium]